ncbi:uncharacterized protein LOC142325203 [Lycorma delicatula]|uniref:uncharacterized protein LOC142325203 n=1 Tax=Lycorma delicatula TaxID=130591 RepID=UPI003F515CDF
MGETPKSTKRKIEESPTLLYGTSSESETIDVTYDFLPKSRLKAGENKCKIPLGLRPHKLIKSPTIHSRTSRKSALKPLVECEEKVEELFKGIFKESSKENIEIEDLKENNKNNNEVCLESSVFDDSSNDLMFELSQRIEEAQESSPLSANRDKRESLYKNQLTKKSISTTRDKNCNRFLASASSNVDQSPEPIANLLLEDGNDAGFFQLDETVFNKSHLCSKISLSQTCTPQEIEAKRREALKKLQEKRLKTKQYCFKQKANFK